MVKIVPSAFTPNEALRAAGVVEPYREKTPFSAAWVGRLEAFDTRAPPWSALAIPERSKNGRLARKVGLRS